MRTLRWLFLGLLALVLLALAVTNRQIVELRLLPEGLDRVLNASMTLNLPLFLVIFAAFLAGVVFGLVWEWLREFKYRTEAADRRREAARLQAQVSRLRATGQAKDEDIIALLDEGAARR